jgi:hypothetical protein
MMTFPQGLMLDVVVVLGTVAVAVMVRNVRQKQRTESAKFFLDGNATASIIGSLMLLLSFVWCSASLFVGAHNPGIALVPALVMAALGWMVLAVAWPWVRQHTTFLVLFGFLGVLASGAWALGLAGILSPSNPNNLYWIIYPPILLGTVSLFAILSPAFTWFFRMTGTISDE